MTDLAIIIVSFNDRDDLAACLATLRDDPPHTPHEVVVVDNASTDGGAEVVGRTFPSVRLIESGSNLGFAKANNIGIRATASELILLLNSDAIASGPAVDRLVAALRTNPAAAVAGPRLVDEGGRAELSFGAMAAPLAELRQKWLTRLHAHGVGFASRRVERLTRSAGRRDWVSGACLLVRRSDAEAVGLFDERYFMYLEDVDFCAAVRARGRDVIFAPDAVVVHRRGRSGAAAPVAAKADYVRSRLAFYAKHHPAWTPWLRLYLRLSGRSPGRPVGAG